MSCLCLGPQGSGKTLLLKKILSDSVDITTTTVETVGTNLVKVPREKSDKYRGRKSRLQTDIIVREVGGAMAPLWPSYYSGAKSILFVADCSNMFQTSITSVCLMEILSHQKLKGVKILIVFNKKDLTDVKKLNEFKFMTRINKVIEQAGSRVTMTESSCVSGDGIDEIRKWLSSSN